MPNKTGRIGYFCSLVPEEIILAAGLQPLRVPGTSGTDLAADGYLSPNLCPYIKNLMSSALEGDVEHLDGVVFARSCDGMRRMYDVWKSHVDTKFIHMLEVPKNGDQLAVGYYASQLRDFAQSLGRAFGVEVTTASVRKATQAMAKMRQSMQYIISLQQATPLPVKGSELFNLGMGVFGENKPLAVKNLAELCQKARRSKVGRLSSHKPRVLISGNVVDRPDLFEIVEAAGGEIPATDLCTSLRFFSRNVNSEESDLYVAMARAYLGEPHCPRTADPAQRLLELKKLVKTYDIDGVLMTSVKFCDQHLYDAPFFISSLKDEGVPVLFLENDYTYSNRSQMKVRVEAFVEVLSGRGI